jgi:FixJ family two-component response regulator/anti-sigma regulatory factor (Ser/Thr protein kinase)
MAKVVGEAKTVLVVEDDPYVLSFMESSLSLAGFRVLSAHDTGQARDWCRKERFATFWAVLSDYRLPGDTGIDLLKWIREEDPTLATLVITGQGEKSIVEDSLKVGAFKYLEKPVTHRELKKAIEEAVEHTRRQRQSEVDRRELEHLEQFDQRMSAVVPAGLKEQVRLFYQPLHEVGGDLFICHAYSPSEWVLFVGDVAGHDIKSGYVSTYFQGMFRGCVENGSHVQDFIDLFNRTLRRQSDFQSPDGDLISLSVSAFYINHDNPDIAHWNYGFTPCCVVRSDGLLEEGHYGQFPLGWAPGIDTAPSHIPVADRFRFYAFTDGLIELAADLDLHPFSLLYRLMEDRNAIKGLPSRAKDDILILEYTINLDLALETQFNPLLSEHYAGTEVEHIDNLQDNWRRSLTFALDDQMGDRLYDLLICIREGMLNALIHGCERASDKFAHLQISINEPKTMLRVVIDDPGRGHQFDLKKRLEDIGGQTGKHLGLGIIQHLSDDFLIDNKGTSLVFDFEINPVTA